MQNIQLSKRCSPHCAYYQGGISVSVWKERKGCNLDKILIWKNNSGSLFCISKDIHCLSDTKEFLYPHVLPKRIIHFNLNWHFLKFNKNDLTEFSKYRRKYFSCIPSQFSAESQQNLGVQDQISVVSSQFAILFLKIIQFLSLFYVLLVTESLFWSWKLTDSRAMCSVWLNKIRANNFLFLTI